MLKLINMFEVSFKHHFVPYKIQILQKDGGKNSFKHFSTIGPELFIALHRKAGFVNIVCCFPQLARI